MLFVDESAQQDGWEAFPTQQLTSDSYAAELIRSQKKAAAASVAPAAPTAPSGASRAGAAAASAPTQGQGLGSFGLNLALSGLGRGLGSLGFGTSTGADGGGNLNTLEDLHDIMTSDPLGTANMSQRRRHSDGSSGGFGAFHEGDDWPVPSAPPVLERRSQDEASSAFAAGGSRGTDPSGSGAASADALRHQHQRGADAAWDPLGSTAVVPAFGGGGGGGSGGVLSLEPPLWLPDSHATECLSCHMPFRPFTRLRHHCRLCGKIFCSACCHKKALLPPKYGVRTPQRDSPDAISLRAWLNSPWTSNLGEDIFKAANMLTTFVKAIRLRPEAGLPTAALQGVEGLALLTVARLGAGWSFSFGTGLVVARTPGGWSAPCAISAAGMGWGLQLGGELADVVLVLRSREALAGLCGGLGAGVVVGGAAALAVGPVGRHADASLVLNTTGTAAAYGYSRSKGAFVGLSVESTLLCVRRQVNLDFYGYPVTPRQLLLETAVPPPPAAAMLYEGIKALLHRFECRRRLVHNRHSGSLQRQHQHQHQQGAAIHASSAVQHQQLLALPATSPAPALADYQPATSSGGSAAYLPSFVVTECDRTPARPAIVI
ncbi:hypothetical protein VOLCADRAFT_119689 [Volvox carteri f. nagariensis]|uniref:FYVE-type domain-containing protein n=1 Tax=Volvox carteri f. nagariensis TaxID=3068 RepID=D8UFH3_VOLCA|nr:uncharacterized protein VOLCADRAFT_119689 [Volvox carteri f. nagariensis]EFJ41459.1 hypothetical protein VOLCADRAFT_119689 [Volvox carteri f. nagariensis]|eukprot:XP_002957404.1 hypothetical protein VOLCADRAFT_119689 [Volvox carteri f. nagariensis]